MTTERDSPCSDWTALLHALADGELDAANSLRCEDHAAACPACTAELTRLRDLRAVLSRDGVAWRAPAALRERILASIAQETTRTSGHGRLDPAMTARAAGAWIRLRAAAVHWTAMPTGFALAASLALAIVVTRPNEPPDLSSQLVSGHVRSLLASHLTDIETSDQHTVKPWFAGKIDFSPPVIDLADRGFALVGGRLDYIENRVVAALIYKRREHIINLFMWPSDVGQPAASAREGYNVLGWQQAGLTFWAVSDLNTAELKEFRDNLTERTPH